MYPQKIGVIVPSSLHESILVSGYSNDFRVHHVWTNFLAILSFAFQSFASAKPRQTQPFWMLSHRAGRKEMPMHQSMLDLQDSKLVVNFAICASLCYVRPSTCTQPRRAVGIRGRGIGVRLISQCRFLRSRGECPASVVGVGPRLY